MLALDRRRRLDLLELSTGVVLIPLAAAGMLAPSAGVPGMLIVIGLVVALLARDRSSLLLSECALKMLWVLGVAVALSWAGVLMLGLATGTHVMREQWAVLQMAIDSDALWRTALPLSLLLGLVLLGAAPFHFWAADLLHGAPGWLAPLAVVALQVCGAEWLAARMSGIESFRDGARLVAQLLASAAALAFAFGGLTLLVQRRPERRVGTLASLNGALLLALLAFAREGPGGAGVIQDVVPRWAAHLVIALTGAGILSRFLPVAGERPEPPPVLFRRHAIAGIAGLYAWFSLAGFPGTPGAALWLETAHAVSRSGRPWVMLALALAWVSALTVAMRQLREALGVVPRVPPPAQQVPWQARVALGACAAGLVMQLSRWI
jgi:NADH:ubiquinone oxidoreductase subunit 2 (subunit N)